MSLFDFLTQPTPERLRKEIVNICDSYSHPWDILAELCQNSVDAIHQHIRNYGEATKNHYIEVSIDALERSISIKDTGHGFDASKFIELLAPHGTDKDPDDFNVIGQKGVGLTYVIFSCNKFTINSKAANSNTVGCIDNASLWKNKKTNESPQFNGEAKCGDTNNPSETYTEIYVKDIDDIFEESEDVFCQTPEIIEYILRTKTAIGSTRLCFEGQHETFKVSLKIKTSDGKDSTREINPNFMLPEEFLTKSSDCIDYDDFVKIAATLDDRQKTQKLQGKCLRKKGSINRAGRDIKFYAFFVPTRKYWKEVSERNKLVKFSKEINENEPLYASGIFISSRSMPTGITLIPPTTGESGYWPNVFMLLEDSKIVFDLGRKSVPGRTQGLLKDLAKDIFNDFIKFRKYITTDPSTQQTITTIQQYEKKSIFEELDKLPGINIAEIGYIKHPDSQEAAVVAIFHELVGAKILNGYKSIKHGYKETYDLWGYYDVLKDNVGKNVRVKEGTRLPIIVEFKYVGEDILYDFEKRIKYFTDIDLIVCWDIDERKFAKENVTVNLIKQDDALFQGSNYELEWPGSYNLGPASKKPVLALKRFLEDFQISH